MQMYQHHYELFLKALFFYFAAVGAIGSYVFRPEASAEQQRWFLVTVICTSVASLVGCWISLRWWFAIKGATDRLCAHLELEPLPLFASKYLIALFAVDCVAIIAACVTYLSARS